MWLYRIALGLTALILIPSGAHLFELPGKMRLERVAYCILQSIYVGRAWFAVPILAIVANIALSFAERRQSPAATSALVSASLTALGLGVFFAFVFPAIRRRTAP